MSFSHEDIALQLRLGEDSRWEFNQVEFSGSRPKSPSRNDLADEIAAFANTDGGVLLCGVTDRGEVQGLSREQMDLLDRLLADICADSIKPPIRPAILRRTVNGRPLLLVEVPQGHAQHDSPGGSFHRVGSTKRRMPSDERLRLAQRRGQARFLWFDKQTVPETGYGTLDKALWKPLLSVQGAADPPASLDKMGLNENGVRQATRNELLTSLLGRVPASGIQGAGGRLFIMERRGDGVPIMRRETLELSGRLPEFRLISNSELCVTIPAASLESTPARAVITVWTSGRPLPGVELLALFPNRTWKRTTTDQAGEATVDLPATHLPMTVFAAAPGYAAHLEREWVPGRGALAAELEPAPDGGSVIFPEASAPSRDQGQLESRAGRP